MFTSSPVQRVGLLYDLPCTPLCLDRESIDNFINSPAFERQCQELRECMLAVVAKVDAPLAEKAGTIGGSSDY